MCDGDTRDQLPKLSEKMPMVNKLRFFILLVVVYLSALSMQSVIASEALPKTSVIAVNKIPGLLVEGQSDLAFNVVLTNLNKKIETDIQYKFYPAARASFVFRNKESLCMFPASLTSNMNDSDALIDTYPLNTAKAFFLSGTVINAKNILAKDAKKLSIGFRRGNTFGGKIDQLAHHNLVPLVSDQQSAKLLNRGRIDIILAYMPDSLALLNMYPKNPLVYSDDSFFYSQGDGFLCHKTEEGIALVAALNKEIEALKSSGELKRLLGNAYLE